MAEGEEPVVALGEFVLILSMAPLMAPLMEVAGEEVVVGLKMHFASGGVAQEKSPPLGGGVLMTALVGMGMRRDGPLAPRVGLVKWLAACGTSQEVTSFQVT